MGAWDELDRNAERDAGSYSNVQQA